LQNKNIIITGGLGFLGFSLVQKFYSENNIMITLTIFLIF